MTPLFKSIRRRVLQERTRLRADADAPKGRSLQQRALRLMAGFLALMLLFTLLSRAADGMTIPQVATASPTGGSLTHKLSAQGRVTAAGSQSILLAAGLLVEELFVQVGDTVQPGDPLLRLNQSDLQNQLDLARNELEKLDAQLQAKQFALSGEEDVSVRNAQRALQNAQSEYDRIDENATEDLRSAQKALSDAQERLQALEGTIGSSGPGATEEELQAARERVSSCQAALDSAQRSREEQRQSAARAIKDAELALQDAQKAAAHSADSQAVANQQTLADMGALRLERQTQQETIAALEALAEAEGLLLAEHAGSIQELFVRQGERTPETPALTLATPEGESEFTARFTPEQAEKLEVGAQVTIELHLDGKRSTVQTTISRIGAEGEDGLLPVSAPLPSGHSYRAGESSSMKVTQQAGPYDMLLPLGALRSDSGGDYVYVVRQSDSVLGKQATAARLPVTVLAQDEQSMAVEGPLAPEDLVVLESERLIEEGDRIRPVLS